MKFELTEDQTLLRDSTRDFLATELPLEKTRRIMEHDPRGFEAASWRRFGEMGYLGLLVPASADGQALGPIELAVVAEEMGRACAPGPFLDVTLAAWLLAASGKAERLLADVAKGEAVVVLARADSPFAGTARPAARLEGGRVRGAKWFVPFASSADALLVATPEGLALVDGPFDVEATPTIDPAQRFARVTLDHPAELVGPPTLLDSVDRVAAVGAGAMLLGVMARSLEITLEYVKTRRAFGRPIGSFQSLQHRAAEMLVRVESTRSAVYRAAWCLANDDPETDLACAAAKAYAGEAGRAVSGESIQMHGGIGFTWELDVHFYFKRAKTLEQFYGSTESQLARALSASGF
jgi:alkylation response protein AidB-like acyl-CoA dehydrogenase